MAITKLQSSRDFFRIWFFWKKQAIFLFFLIIGLVMFYAYTVTPKYESTAEILVLPKTNEGEVVTTGLVNEIVPVTKEDIFTEMELMSSNTVLKETVESFGSSGINLSKTEIGLFDRITNPIKNTFRKILDTLKLTSSSASETGKQIELLKKALIIEPIIDSDLILLSLQSQKPERSTLVLEKLLETYLSARNLVFTQEQGRKFYDDQSISYKSKLEEAEEALKNFQKKWNIVNLKIQNQANIDLLTRLNSELKILEIEYEEGISKISALKAVTKKDPSMLHLTKDMRDIPAIVELEKGIVPILIKRSELSKTFVETSREYKSINSQILMLRNEIRNEIKKAIRTEELELVSKNVKIESLKNKINLLKTEANKFSQREKEHKELERQVTLYRDNYLLYTQKTENAFIDYLKRDRKITNVSIASKPTTPEVPIFPNRLLMLVLAVFFGSFAALCIPFVIESIDTKIKTADDVETMLKLPVISSFPNLN